MDQNFDFAFWTDTLPIDKQISFVLLLLITYVIFAKKISGKNERDVKLNSIKSRSCPTGWHIVLITNKKVLI